MTEKKGTPVYVKEIKNAKENYRPVTALSMCKQSVRTLTGKPSRNIFQNNLSYNVDSALSMYADDHQIYEKGQDVYCTCEASGECHSSD